MMWNPFMIWNSGFQMSFAAIIAIVLVFTMVKNILQVKQIHLAQLKVDENSEPVISLKVNLEIE